MEGKKRSFTFQTKTIYFPPLKKKVNILLQQRDGPCMLIAIFNSLVLKGKISIECGVYSSSSIISTIQNCDIDAYDLEKLLHGYYVNPVLNLKIIQIFLANLILRWFMQWFHRKNIKITILLKSTLMIQ